MYTQGRSVSLLQNFLSHGVCYNMSSKTKRHCLTLKEKVSILNLLEKKERSVADIQKEFACGRTQIYDLVKRKAEVLSEWENGDTTVSKKKRRTTGNEEVNKLTWEWFVQARSKNIPLSGPFIQEQAKLFAKKLGRDEFRASNGWLESFKNRHAIVWNSVSGESNDVDMSLVDDWKSKIGSLLEGYKPEDVYNCDETGLFFRALPNKTFAQKGDRCVGGKMSKERLTVLVCGNMRGDLEKLVVIGKAAKPRCFKNLKIPGLPVMWKSSKKAWNTAHLMEEWLHSFNHKMKTQGRKVILFLDNATCHPHLSLSHVKLAWFPANTTSITQPMDQGVIYCLKKHYRRRLIRRLLACMQTVGSVTELAKSITVLDAINFLSKAVQDVSSETVQKCFSKAGFPVQLATINDSDEETRVKEDEVPPGYDVEAFHDFIVCDEGLETSETRDVSSIPFSVSNNDESDSEMEEKEDDESTNEFDSMTYIEALEVLKRLNNFALHRGNNELHTMLDVCQNMVEKDVLMGMNAAEQKKITDYFPHPSRTL